MRERLTAAFVVLTVVLLLGAGVVRTFVLRDMVREQEATHLQHEVRLIAMIVQHRQAGGGAVDRDFLGSLVGTDDRLEVATGGGGTLVAHGSDYRGTDDPDRDMSAVASLPPGGTVTLSQSGDVVSAIVSRGIGSLVALFVLIAVVAGVVGFLIASALSSPFPRLAVAAGALGRGRFDLDLPRTRIPEARAISTALRTSATQLEDRLHRERDFAEHASHVLRTPLTGMRLELEDLTLRDDVSDDVKAAATRSIAAVDEVSTVAGELVELSRRGSLVAGSELALVDLATSVAQRWADRLGARHRTLTAAAEGDLSLTYTPGPVEHVTDLLLADVVRRGSGAVDIVFHGEASGHLRIHVASSGRVEQRADPGDPDGTVDRVVRVREVVGALGGRVAGDHPADGIEVLLPRR